MYRANCNSVVPADECSLVSGPLHSNTGGMAQSHVSYCVLDDWFRNTGWIHRQVSSLLSCDWWHLKLQVWYSLKATLFWDATPCSLVGVDQHLGWTCRLHFWDRVRFSLCLLSVSESHDSLHNSCYFCYVLFLLVPSFTNVIPVRKKNTEPISLYPRRADACPPAWSVSGVTRIRRARNESIWRSNSETAHFIWRAHWALYFTGFWQ
jgi:hypothetical protein